MASIYNLIENNLNNLRFHTELLESCDWDEALLEDFSSHLQMAFHYISEEEVNYDDGKVLLKEILELNGWENGQCEIIINLMEDQKNEIISFMKLEEQ